MISVYFSKITTTALFEIGGFLKIKAVIFYGRGTILIPTFLIIHSISFSLEYFLFLLQITRTFHFRVPTLLSRSGELFKDQRPLFEMRGSRSTSRKTLLQKTSQQHFIKTTLSIKTNIKTLAPIKPFPPTPTLN